MPVIDAGDAWFEQAAPAVGAVCGAFRRAAYLRLDGRILAVCDAQVAPGPLHLRLDRLPDLAVGRPVQLGGGRLSVGPWSVAVEDDRRWTPRPVDPQALRQALALRPRHGAGQPTVVAEAGLAQPILDRIPALLQDGDLVSVAHLVGGRGAGLTPAGDDLLAGVLVAHAALDPAGAHLRRAAAAASQTSDVAAAFLRWAAAGQCILPVHRVLEAIAAGDHGSEAAARQELRRIGATSGSALLLGIDLACRHRI
jgi:hypothetical protein